MTNHTITLQSGLKKITWMQAARNWVTFFGLVAVGIYFDSSILQAMGMILAIASVALMTANRMRENTGLTIAEARRRLDEIEREEALQTAGTVDAKAAAFREDVIERVTRKGPEK